MKLNYKRTILVGFAFFLISAFWGAYDAIVPKILTNLYHMKQSMSGLIMSFDNILAVVMLPLFGAASDKVQSKWGKRTPFIFFGTCCAVAFFILLGTIQSVDLLWLFIVVLLLTLISMATFRSPAVALMPDVTLKPLRSKGNAIINLMGTAGGILVLVFGIIFKTGAEGKTNFLDYIIAVCALMLFGLIIFLLTVREPRWAAEMEAETERLGLNQEEAATAEVTKGGEQQPQKRGLSFGEKCSLFLILASVALWYIGYNAVTSKYSVYAEQVLHVDFNTTLIVAQAAAIVSYIPVGIISSKVGRKKAILTGIVMLTTAFVIAIFLKNVSSEPMMFPIFALAGIGWATINVNSFPMVVELAKLGDTGKYTGYYYTASMSAQIVTPILSGFLIDRIGWDIFFPYAALFAALSFVTMLFVKHGDSKPEAKKSVLEALDVED